MRLSRLSPNGYRFNWELKSRKLLALIFKLTRLLTCAGLSRMSGNRKRIITALLIAP